MQNIEAKPSDLKFLAMNLMFCDQDRISHSISDLVVLILNDRNLAFGAELYMNSLEFTTYAIPILISMMRAVNGNEFSHPSLSETQSRFRADFDLKLPGKHGIIRTKAGIIVSNSLGYSFGFRASPHGFSDRAIAGWTKNVSCHDQEYVITSLNNGEIYFGEFKPDALQQASASLI
jgi:hypothetical protein